MKKIYISSSPTYVDDFFTFKFKRDASEMGYQVLNKDFDNYTYDQNIEKKLTVEYYISQADIFIAVLVDKNPNVFYELGYATALGKKVLLISDIDIELPEQLKKFNYIRFDNNLANSAYYNIFNFLEKTRIEEQKTLDSFNDLRTFLSSLQENPQIIDRISGPELENLVYDYFRNIKGIGVEKPTQSSDYGFDLMLFGWQNFHKTIVEIKKYNKNSKVSVTTIQQVVGAMNIYEAEHAIIMTTSEFTSSAKDFATTIGKKVELWDLEYLLMNI